MNSAQRHTQWHSLRPAQWSAKQPAQRSLKRSAQRSARRQSWHARQLKRLHGENGQAMVELAVTLPILVLVLCAVLEFGWIFVNDYGVQQASYAGARCASLNVESVSSSQLETLVEQRVGENLWQDPASATVSLTVDTDDVTVTVTYPVQTLTFIGYGLFGTTYTATSTSVAVY